MDNTPTLMKSEEERAPWNERVRCIGVDISQTLSTTAYIEVPADLDNYDSETLKTYVEEQVFLPSDFKDVRDWVVDDFCVVYDNRI
jgi:hypothetical protein